MDVLNASLTHYLWFNHGKRLNAWLWARKQWILTKRLQSRCKSESTQKRVSPTTLNPCLPSKSNALGASHRAKTGCSERKKQVYVIQLNTYQKGGGELTPKLYLA